MPRNDVEDRKPAMKAYVSDQRFQQVVFQKAECVVQDEGAAGVHIQRQTDGNFMERGRFGSVESLPNASVISGHLHRL